MRVLRIDSWEGDIGGGQVYVRSVADELSARGHPQHLLNLVTKAPDPPRPDEEHVLRPPRARQRLAADLGADAQFEATFRRACESFEPDLVHLHRFDAMFTPIARALSEIEVPIVFTAHDAELVCPISTLIQPGGVVCDGGVRPRCLFTGCRVGWGGPSNLLADEGLRPGPGPARGGVPLPELAPGHVPPPARVPAGDPSPSVRADPRRRPGGAVPSPRRIGSRRSSAISVVSSPTKASRISSAPSPPSSATASGCDWMSPATAGTGRTSHPPPAPSASRTG